MQCLFIINPEWNQQQIEQQYLLMLAMLNFDHKVAVIFSFEALSIWQQNEGLQKKLHALKMYGVTAIYVEADKYVFNGDDIIAIDSFQKHQLIQQADFVS